MAVGLLLEHLLGVNLSTGKSRNVRNLGILERACSLASSGSPAVLLVCRNVETNEQKQVRADDGHTGESSELLAGALSVVREVGEVRRGEVGPAGKVDEAEVDNKLNDLETGDPFLPPDTDAAGALEVVPVHHNVNHEVESDRNP